jgi:hypothetical protein
MKKKIGMIFNFWMVNVNQMITFPQCNSLYFHFSGFINSSSFLRMSNEKNPYVERLPIGAVHVHAKNVSNQAVYFSDVIVHSDQL